MFNNQNSLVLVLLLLRRLCHSLSNECPKLEIINASSKSLRMIIHGPFYDNSLYEKSYREVFSVCFLFWGMIYNMKPGYSLFPECTNYTENSGECCLIFMILFILYFSSSMKFFQNTNICTVWSLHPTPFHTVLENQVYFMLISGRQVIIKINSSIPLYFRILMGSSMCSPRMLML